MASEIAKLYNYRIKYSSFDMVEQPINIPIDNTKYFNINNMKLSFNFGNILLSTFYTNPYTVDNKITKNILWNPINSKLHQIILSEKKPNKIDEFIIKKIIQNKNRKFQYLTIDKSLIILWSLVYFSKLSPEYYKFIKKLTRQFITSNINFIEIINIMINSIDPIEKKVYWIFYILAEEFHYKYITKKFSKIKSKYISFNYITINPNYILNILNDFDELKEYTNIPQGHNTLMILYKHTIYYYDPDISIQSDLLKIKMLLKSLKINFQNISSRNPIQTIFDDSNCVFYCLNLVKYFESNYFNLSKNNLIFHIVKYENICINSKYKSI